MAEIMSQSALSGAEVHEDVDSIRILQSMLNFARLMFSAPAASVFTYDPATDELKFEASAGIGGVALADSRMPATAGIAGMVIQTGMATIADNLSANSNFNREFAAQSGYVPDAICAAPLLYDDDIIGVVEVLDPDFGRLAKLDVLTIVEALADVVAESLHILCEFRRLRLQNHNGASLNRRKIFALLDALPEAAFQDGRCRILEAVLSEISRPHS